MPRSSATQHELARIELLAGLPGEVLMKLAKRMERLEIPPGDNRRPRGRAGRALLRRLRGMLSVTNSAMGPRDILRPGDYFGEVSVTMNMPRTATVTAITPAVVAGCDRATFDEFLRPLFADDDRSLKRGQASIAQSPNSLSVSTPQASPRIRIDPEEGAVPPKWPNVRGELCELVQCGDLSSRNSNVRPQSFGSIRPHPGSTPASPGNWTDVASSRVSGRNEGRREQLAARA